ncbi:hypothetical protein C8F01DRAFT_1242455 [Mycena amicta]|nr:hypothetical protein C8F01DRAFT_1242455 [Mycena amicta]
MPVPARQTSTYHLRGRSPPSNRLHRLHTSPQLAHSRRVLAPLVTNLRRRPSRLNSSQKLEDDPMPPIQVGSKRKRVPSANENAHSGGRPTRGSGRLKRLRSDTYEASDASEMDIDVPPPSSRWSGSGSPSDEEPLSELSADDDDQEESSVTASFARTTSCGCIRPPAFPTTQKPSQKPEIIDSLVAAREELSDLPPSSPRGVSSDEPDNDPNDDDDDDEVHTPLPALRSRFTNGLRRRATVNETSALTSRPSKSRSLSMGHLLNNPVLNVASGSNLNGNSVSSPAVRRRQPSRALQTAPSFRTSFPPLHAVSSPPATRLRSRKHITTLSLSAPLSSASASSPVMPTHGIPFPATIQRSTAAAKGRGKGKGKQVEFLPLEEIEREKERQRELERRALAEESESDLTEIESESMQANPSPRRLRSKDKERLGKGKENVAFQSALDLRRDAVEEDEAEVEAQMHASDEEDEDECDQLATPTRGRSTRSSLKAKSRSPGSVPPVSTEAGADGDDEEEEEEDDVDGEEEEDTVDGEEEEEDRGNCGTARSSATTWRWKTRRTMTAKRLTRRAKRSTRKGEEVDEEIEEGQEVEEDEAEPDAEGETDENVDLAIATAKTLTRDLEAVGTKPQLAEALLQWRDRQADASSPSSTGTVTGRPPSTPQTPVLLRSQRVHIDEPVTPEPKEAPIGEPELELDLESLGLDDREIPPDKLQKLEKIGSGGFKDVFIGKFRGRRIAISEFRGQLSAMDIKELKLLGGFDHPNIVRFLGVSIPEDTKVTPVMIVSELCSNGDLFDYVRNVPAPSLNKVLTIMLDIARGLEYLHLRKPSVIHRDCKSSNILITAKGTAKIADFGLAKVKQSTRSMVRSLVGTVNWQAPELWHAHPKYNHKVDVFSCAMVYWEMLQWHQKDKKFPWEGMNEHAIYEIVGTKKQRPPTTGLRKQWCPAIVDLLERMWAQQHEDRPTMSEVVLALEEIKK